MNVNANSDALVKLHKAYTVCIEDAMHKFLNPEAKKDLPAGEFCAVEKQRYFDHMATHH